MPGQSTREPRKYAGAMAPTRHRDVPQQFSSQLAQGSHVWLACRADRISLDRHGSGRSGHRTPLRWIAEGGFYFRGEKIFIERHEVARLVFVDDFFGSGAL